MANRSARPPQAARDAYIAGVDGVLSAAHGDQAHLAHAIEADPDFALAHAALARARFLMADVAGARQSAARARELAAQPRRASKAMSTRLPSPSRASRSNRWPRRTPISPEHPRDAMVASPATGVFGLIGFSGRQGREPEQVEFLETLRPHLADDWWFQAVYAFALEEVGRLDEALDLIERSMAANPRNAHGAHIKAHVLYELGEDRAALDYLDSWLPAYPREGLMHCHISWHVALFALMLGDTDRAWQVYEAQVHPGGAWGPALNVATDAPAFLWRAELAGHARRPTMWKDVHDYARKSFPKAGVAFVDVHRALAHVAAGDREGIAAIVSELEQRVACRPLAGGRRGAAPGDRPRGLRPRRLAGRHRGPRAGAGRDRAHRRQPRAARPDREHTAGGLSQGRPRRRRAQAGRGARRPAAVGTGCRPRLITRLPSLERDTRPAPSTVSRTSV